MSAKRRTLLPAIIVALAVAIAAGVFFYVGTLEEPDAPATASAPATGNAPAATAASRSDSELLQEGPLPEMVLGDPDAPVTIVEYASLTCVHCASFHNNTYPVLKEKYIDTGKVRFIFREFPLDNVAAAGFMLARCAEGSSYFPIVEAFFEQQQSLFNTQDPLGWITNFARQAGYTQESMEACLTNQELLTAIQEVKQRGSEKFRVQSTPTLFINGEMVPGALTVDELEQRLQPLLKS